MGPEQSLERVIAPRPARLAAISRYPDNRTSTDQPKRWLRIAREARIQRAGLHRSSSCHCGTRQPRRPYAVRGQWP